MVLQPYSHQGHMETLELKDIAFKLDLSKYFTQTSKKSLSSQQLMELSPK